MRTGGIADAEVGLEKKRQLGRLDWNREGVPILGWVSRHPLSVRADWKRGLGQETDGIGMENQFPSKIKRKVPSSQPRVESSSFGPLAACIFIFLSIVTLIRLSVTVGRCGRDISFFCFHLLVKLNFSTEY